MDISRVFTTQSCPIYEWFTRGDIGYYIPLYQREYSWDKYNIDQLMDDICNQVQELHLMEDTQSIHFMGTVITVQKNIDKDLNPKSRERAAYPTRVDSIIDGQQRISTLALLACQLYKNLTKLINKVNQKQKKEQQKEAYGELKEATEAYQNKLIELFSYDKKTRGHPTRKPIIIRGSTDKGWTLKEDDKVFYKSDVSYFLAQFIRSIYNQSDFPDPDNLRQNSKVINNLKEIEKWLQKIENSHEGGNENFPSTENILYTIQETDLWEYPRPELKDFIDRNNGVPNEVRALVQLFVFCHYLLDRCCFTWIEPSSEVRAFDMFQSLNATGTPLTSLETFKPLVVNIAEREDNGYEDSEFQEHYSKVENLMANLTSASSKDKRTKEYLVYFKLAYDGIKKPLNQFSMQRKWLMEEYKDNQQSLEQKKEFIREMGNIAEYSSHYVFSPKKPRIKKAFPEFNYFEEKTRKESAFCLCYLHDAGHKMANTVLSRFYSKFLRKEPDSEKSFIKACKMIAAFFTLWRSALSNQGLDDEYRKLLQDKISWKANPNPSIKALQERFNIILNNQNIGTRERWMRKAQQNLRYDLAPKAVCRFTLFITSQDTIPDPDRPGLMKPGRPDTTSPYLDPDRWWEKNELKTIEHIAPHPNKENGPPNNWDEQLYENDNYNKIGNLTLLPMDINSAAGNRNWESKLMFYKYLAEKDPEQIGNLQKEEEKFGRTLPDKTINLLKEAKYSEHIKPIVEVGKNGSWDKDLVDRRTERMCGILWDKLREWLPESTSTN